MLSINQIIEANKKRGDSPYFLIDTQFDGFSNFAFVANSIKRTNLMTPDEVSRELIQQITNLACHVNLMEISFETKPIYQGVIKFRKALPLAKILGSIFHKFESVKQKTFNLVIEHSGLTTVTVSVGEITTLLPKIEDHLDEMLRITELQATEITELVTKYRNDCMERKILSNTIISNILAGGSSNTDDTKMLNDVFVASEFDKHFDEFVSIYLDFYTGVSEQIALAKKSLNELSVNFSSLVDVIDSSISSPIRSLDLMPTNSFEADMATLVRKSINGEVPLFVLASVLEKHIFFISEANSILIEVSNTIDQRVNYFGEKIRIEVQPHVSCDLVKVTAESMLNTQRKYEYSSEN